MPEVSNELLSAFVDQAREALASMVGLELAFDELSRPQAPQPAREIYSAVNLEGGLSGCVMLALDRPLALTIVSKMLMAEPDEIEEDLLDGVGEVLNVIVGNAKTTLQRGSPNIVLKPPETVAGELPKSMDNENAPGVVVCCTVAGHAMSLWIWLPGVDEGVPEQGPSDAAKAELPESDPSIIVLGRKTQRSLQTRLFEPLPQAFAYVDHWHDVLRSAMRETPLAVLIEEDLIASDPELAFLFQLETTWPVLRFNIGPTGEGELISSDGRSRRELSRSIAEVAAREQTWLPCDGMREDLRVPLVCRVRYRTSACGEWQNANSLDIGARGAFVVSYEPPAVDTAIEIVVSDLGEEEIRVSGRVLWTRSWQDGAQLPGVGLRLEPSVLGVAALQKFGLEVFSRHVVQRGNPS